MRKEMELSLTHVEKFTFLSHYKIALKIQFSFSARITKISNNLFLISDFVLILRYLLVMH